MKSIKTSIIRTLNLPQFYYFKRFLENIENSSNINEENQECVSDK